MAIRFALRGRRGREEAVALQGDIQPIGAPGVPRVAQIEAVLASLPLRIRVGPA